MTTEATTKEALEPCPLAHPIVNGVRFTNFSNNVKAHIWCYDCGLEFEGRVNEPRDKVAERWNSRVSAPIVAPVVDVQELQRKADELPAACEHGNLDPRDVDRLIEEIAAAPASPVALRDEADTVDAERQAAAIVTIWRAIKDHDDKLLVRYIKQALLEWKPVATTTPPSTLAKAAAAEIADYVSDGVLGMGNEVTEADTAKILAIIERCLAGGE